MWFYVQDGASFVDHRFDCRDLLQRGVIHYEAERKASSAIISAAIQGVTTGTVASVSCGPSEDAPVPRRGRSRSARSSRASCRR
jgi:hypothetical protein